MQLNKKKFSLKPHSPHFECTWNFNISNYIATVFTSSILRLQFNLAPFSLLHATELGKVGVYRNKIKKFKIFTIEI